MKPLSLDQLKACSKLLENNDFTRFLGWLEDELKAAREDNDDLEGIALTKSQGVCKTLSQILGEVRGSPETLSRINKPSSRKGDMV